MTDAAAKRLAMLEAMVGAGRADSFTRYALALEYKLAGRVDDATRAFEALRDVDAGYVPMYLMAGQMLVEAGRAEAARVWLEQGIGVARGKGDGKALGELEQVLGEL